MTARPACAAADCERPVHARGHCERHYRQLLRRGEVTPDRAPVACAVPACGRRAVTRGYCHGHYLRWSRQGDVRADLPLARPEADVCRHPACERGAHSAGWCRSHKRRLDLYGSADGGRPPRTRTEGGHLSHGYWKVVVPLDELHLTGGLRYELEHRLVMARVLGRRLEPEEVVHHRNGDRLDNRPDNLELWTTAQPKGQRVADRVAHALGLLRRYAPHPLADDARRAGAP